MKSMIISISIIAIGLLAVSSFFIAVNESEYVVVTQFGNPVNTIDQAGLHRKLPWQTVNRFDRRVQLYESPMIEYLTGDKKNVVLQSFVCWRIEDPLEFFRAVRTFESATQKLDDLVCASIGAKLGDYKMANLISVNPGEVLIPEMESVIADEVNKKTADGYGISVMRVGISRLALPEDNAQSVYKRMEAERSAIASEYRALGEEEAERVRAQADREKSDIIADAYRQAQMIRGEGDAQAAKIYADAYSKAPDFFRLVRSLEAYKKMLNKQSVVVMSADSDLLKYLNGACLAEHEGNSAGAK
ncbi:MAG: protease modulator HflC [Candidatus Abyssobacteria bacterium SURF_17]|uniref:Protein HflC n=1 Tax=Candidatus Abyssobacteria bacterium SURF_17 TaxID=2093361 RepID=A0A419EPX2_9BACT|nr:MAG: protease modulator HflC [Candidatus Abyssubacteria bacterium SURF_17]